MNFANTSEAEVICDLSSLHLASSLTRMWLASAVEAVATATVARSIARSMRVFIGDAMSLIDRVNECA